MKKIRHYLKRSYSTVINSIAFYPTLMSISAIAFAIFMLYFEYSSTSENFKAKIKVALVANEENARLILGTIVGGIISLTVFSFSMVMVVLNRASATLSPRVIPGIISSKPHQFVLGFYISTIIYSLMLIININTNESRTEVPSLGILFSMLFAITCLGLFVYFIDNISKSIQVDNILNRIFLKTIKQLDKIFYGTKGIVKTEVEEGDWYPVNAPTRGYLNALDAASLCTLLQKNELKLRVNVTKGFFIPKGYPFISLNKDVAADEKLQNKVLSHLELEAEQDIKEHFNFGFTQITEIAVKALSPGINDPGTAQKALDQLNVLFEKRMKYPNYQVIKDKENTVRIIIFEWSMEQLLFRHLNPIREYGKDDIFVMINQLSLIKNLMYTDEKGEYTDLLVEHAMSVIEDVERYNKNSIDIKHFNAAIENVNKISPRKFKKL